jgi:hypothetical protein
MEIAVLKQGAAPSRKTHGGLPTSPHSRRAPCLNPDRQSDSLTLLEIAPSKFQPHSGRHLALSTVVVTLSVVRVRLVVSAHVTVGDVGL